MMYHFDSNNEQCLRGESGLSQKYAFTKKSIIFTPSLKSIFYKKILGKCVSHKKLAKTPPIFSKQIRSQIKPILP